MKNSIKKISILIPAYNEQSSIIALLEKVAAQKESHQVELEVIVIDDASADNTEGLLKQNPSLYSKMIRHEKNQGKGAAVKTGLKVATGDYILFQDADLEYDPNDYQKLFMPILKHNAEVVMGSRMIASPCTRVYYFWHKLGNKMLTLFFNILNNTTFTDTYSCYLLYKKDLINPEDLITEGWAQHAEILSRVVSRSQVVYEVPVNYYGRTYEEGKKIRWYHVLEVFWAMLRFRFSA